LTSVLVLALVLSFAFIVAFIAGVAIKLLRSAAPEPITPNEWAATFSVATYEPMQALLCEDDFAFLSRQPGFDLLLYKKLRRERLRIFRQYMNRLIADYNRLHAAARLLLASAPYDQSQMLGRLVRLRLSFSAVLARLGELNEQVAAMAAIQSI
jgi:hypothetical protein